MELIIGIIRALLRVFVDQAVECESSGEILEL